VKTTRVYAPCVVQMAVPNAARHAVYALRTRVECAPRGVFVINAALMKQHHRKWCVKRARKNAQHAASLYQQIVILLVVNTRLDSAPVFNLLGLYIY
jgi:hypothetical protein